MAKRRRGALGAAFLRTQKARDAAGANGQGLGRGDLQGRWYDLVANALTMRQEIFKQMADPRRDIDAECGYAKTERSAWDYQQQYDRHGVAARVTEVWVAESWQVQPEVYELEDEDVITPFEAALDDLGKVLRGERSWHQDATGNVFWAALRQADVLSGIGHHGVVFLGFDDARYGRKLSEPVAGLLEEGSLPGEAPPPTGLPKDVAVQKVALPTANQAGGWPVYRLVANAPVNPAEAFGSDAGASPSSPEEIEEGEVTEKMEEEPGTVPGRQLLFLRCFSESQAWVASYETNPYSPRYGKPTSYNVTFHDPAKQGLGAGPPSFTQNVHWTRCVHLADNHHHATSSDVYASPRCYPVQERLDDLRKLYGGSAEMYWRGAFPGYVFSTHPQLGGEVDIDEDSVKDMIENWSNGLQRYLVLMGMGAQGLAPQVSDPASQIRVQIEAICIKLSIPIRVFLGSERGELASSQDDAAWNDRLKGRQQSYISPRVIAPVLDRLILCGVLPEPAEGYTIYWPDLTSQTEAEKAGVAATKTNTLAAYVGGQLSALVPEREFLVKVMGFTAEETDAMLEAAAEAALTEEPGEEVGENVAPIKEEGPAAALPPVPPAAGPAPPSSPEGAGAVGNAARQPEVHVHFAPGSLVMPSVETEEVVERNAEGDIVRVLKRPLTAAPSAGEAPVGNAEGGQGVHVHFAPGSLSLPPDQVEETVERNAEGDIIRVVKRPVSQPKGEN